MTEQRRAWLTLALAYLRVPELEALLAHFGTPAPVSPITRPPQSRNPMNPPWIARCNGWMPRITTS